MSARPKTVALAIVLAMWAPGAPAQEGHRHSGNPETLGRVVFPTSCRTEVQTRFERAVAMLHSFWFEQAEKAFQEIAAADPRCAMAHWGVAMTLLGNPFTGQAPPESRLKAALAAAERAVALAARAQPRERRYADAALALYRDADRVEHRARLRAHEEAMRLVHEQYPDDAEAAIFYARAVIANGPPNDLEV